MVPRAPIMYRLGWGATNYQKTHLFSRENSRKFQTRFFRECTIRINQRVWRESRNFDELEKIFTTKKQSFYSPHSSRAKVWVAINVVMCCESSNAFYLMFKKDVLISQYMPDLATSTSDLSREIVGA